MAMLGVSMSLLLKDLSVGRWKSFVFQVNNTHNNTWNISSIHWLCGMRY
jgi:hypothetical protein